MRQNIVILKKLVKHRWLLYTESFRDFAAAYKSADLLTYLRNATFGNFGLQTLEIHAT